ncbi:MAG TPA: helix-turn-helix transcriptional regulator, partial [Mesorhizobium sp.]|nr:helix-turn-helix transcriptional regulator [Mesorhizobium sp.]
DNAQVSPSGDAGAFVAAWVWVPNVPKASPDKKRGRPRRSETRGILFIGEWMEAMGFDTDQKLADKMGGTTRETVQRWRTGKGRPPTEAITRIAGAMGIEPEQLRHKPPGDYLM